MMYADLTDWDGRLPVQWPEDAVEDNYGSCGPNTRGCLLCQSIGRDGERSTCSKSGEAARQLTEDEKKAAKIKKMYAERAPPLLHEPKETGGVESPMREFWDFEEKKSKYKPLLNPVQKPPVVSESPPRRYSAREEVFREIEANFAKRRAAEAEARRIRMMMADPLWEGGVAETMRLYNKRKEELSRILTPEEFEEFERREKAETRRREAPVIERLREEGYQEAVRQRKEEEAKEAKTAHKSRHRDHHQRFAKETPWKLAPAHKSRYYPRRLISVIKNARKHAIYDAERAAQEEANVAGVRRREF